MLPGVHASGYCEKQKESAGDFVKQLAHHARDRTQKRRQRGNERANYTIRHADILAERARRHIGYCQENGTCLAPKRIIEWR